MSAAIILVVGCAYAIVLALGFASLNASDQPIGDPYFTALEALILVLAPAMVVLMAVVHSWSAHESKAMSLAALSFTGMMATVTCSVHFVILALSGQPGSAGHAMAGEFLAFRWPSLVYVLDILAWDVFFALSMLFAATVFRGGGIIRAIRISMIISGVLALAGLLGVTTGNMTIRDVGIAGYLGVFLVVDTLLLILFLRSDATQR